MVPDIECQSDLHHLFSLFSSMRKATQLAMVFNFALPVTQIYCIIKLVFIRGRKESDEMSASLFSNSLILCLYLFMLSLR